MSGTPATIRGRYVLGNTVNGIHVQTGGSDLASSISRIDLGKNADGHNTLQDASGTKLNGGAGTGVDVSNCSY